MHKAARLGWEQTSRAWLQDRIRAAIPHATTAEELLAYLEAGDVVVKPRRGPSGDLLGYSVGRPGDLNKDGEQIYHPGGKIAPDLTLPKLKARLEASTPEEYPTARRNRPGTPWHRATEALDTFSYEISGTGEGAATRGQGQIAALGELIEATAQAAPAELRAELRTAARAFAHAQRSQIRAEHDTATGLRTAARDLVNAGTGKDGSPLAVLLSALIWSAILAERWHTARSFAQQATAAHQSVQHLQAAYDQAAAPQLVALAQRQPNPDTRATLANDLRAAVPDHAARILADPDWPALATVLADAEDRGHQPARLLKEAAEQRDLHTARRPARVLLGRIQHTSRNPAPNPRAEAARLRSPTTGACRPVQEHTPEPAAPIPLSDAAGSRRRR
jgi:hypothetical protein